MLWKTGKQVQEIYYPMIFHRVKKSMLEAVSNLQLRDLLCAILGKETVACGSEIECEL